MSDPGNRHKIRPDAGIATRFKPGQSGNPSGRPKKKPLTEELERLASDPEYALATALALVERAKSGDVSAFREFADRVEGKVKDELELSGGLEFSASISDAYSRSRTRK